MGRMYKNQTALQLVATVGQDITSAAPVLIKYIKPDGTTGSFNASISDALTGVISYTVADENDIDQAGKWVLWAHVTFGDGRYAAGEAFTPTVYTEGE